MSNKRFPGTEGYAEQSASLIGRYEGVSFELKHEPVLPFLPALPCKVLDIGAGTGFDAGWFVARRCAITAVEPTLEFLEVAKRLHPDRNIRWLHDGLPALQSVVAFGGSFDVLMLSAVWMHLDEAARRQAMPVVASLLTPGGIMSMNLRRGPVPAGRTMYQVTGSETVELALTCGLHTLFNASRQSIQAENRKAGVWWTQLVFTKSSPGLA